MDTAIKFHYNFIFPYILLSLVGLKFALLDLLPNWTVQWDQVQLLCNFCIMGRAGVSSHWKKFSGLWTGLWQRKTPEKNCRYTADMPVSHICVPCHPIRQQFRVPQGPDTRKGASEMQQGWAAGERGHNAFHCKLAPAPQDGRKLNVTETWHNALKSLPPLPL